MITIKEYKEAKEELGKIDKGQEKAEEKFREQLRKINDKFYKLKREVENKADEEEKEKRKEKNEVYDKYEEMKEHALSISKEYKGILNFLIIEKETRNRLGVW